MQGQRFEPKKKAVVNAIMSADTYTIAYSAARTEFKCGSIEMKE
jgi:hypothetical protein